MQIDRFGVKFFCAEGGDVPLPEFIPIFHRWIQTTALAETLIDVADYSHVPSGPGVILVAHEGVFGVDETGGRRGLVYYLRRPFAGSLGDGLKAVTRTALGACERLAAEAEMQDRVAFRGEELQVFAHDRLHAPNTEATASAFQPTLQELLAALYPGVECRLAHELDPKERFAITVTAPGQVSTAALLERLAA